MMLFVFVMLGDWCDRGVTCLFCFDCFVVGCDVSHGKSTSRVFYSKKKSEKKLLERLTFHYS